MARFGKHNEYNTFAECMRICQVEEKEKCLSVTFFPSLKGGAKQGPFQTNFVGIGSDGSENFNCFLHSKRCHEDSQFRDLGQGSNTMYCFRDKKSKLLARNFANLFRLYKLKQDLQGSRSSHIVLRLQRSLFLFAKIFHHSL